jgi:hypothetical protein
LNNTTTLAGTPFEHFLAPQLLTFVGQQQLQFCQSTTQDCLNLQTTSLNSVGYYSNKKEAMTSSIKTSISDLDAAIRSLEVSTNPTLRRPCNCNASRHPLLTSAPNCLNCGKSQ